RRDRLLTQWRERDDAEIDLVAGLLLVLGDHPFERRVFLLGKALSPPHFRGRGCGVCDIGSGQGADRAKRERAAKHRTPRYNGHLCLLARSCRQHVSTVPVSAPGYCRAAARPAQTLTLAVPKLVLSSGRSGISRRSPRCV